MFLTPEELKTLTGYEVAGWQSRWLHRHNWVHERAANGRIVVSRAYAESRLSGVQQAKPAVVMNLDAIRRRA